MALRGRLAGAKARLRGAAEIDLTVKSILEKHHVARYLKVARTVREEHSFQQTKRGRPGPDTAYRKITKQRYDIEWHTDEEAIAYDHKSDGMYLLQTVKPICLVLPQFPAFALEQHINSAVAVSESRMGNVAHALRRRSACFGSFTLR